jgi:AraC-like DNA-binding protein
MLNIQTYIPKALTPFIHSFWYLKVPEDRNDPYIEEILPDGHHEIIFYLNALPARKRSGSHQWQNDPRVFFTGQNRKSYTHRFDPGTIIYGIRFQPHTQALFYNFPASLSTDNLIELGDVAAKDVLPTCITESPAKTFANLERELTRKAAALINHNNTFQYVDAAVHAILNEHGNVKIEHLEKRTGVTSRHLEKSFQKYVGISPKHFCNLVRHNHFITYRKHHPHKTLTECAYETGFYDQSQLIYLSQRITGHSPKTYFQTLNYINDYFLEH